MANNLHYPYRNPFQMAMTTKTSTTVYLHQNGQIILQRGLQGTRRFISSVKISTYFSITRLGKSQLSFKKNRLISQQTATTTFLVCTFTS